MYLKCFPVPNAIRSSSTFISSTTEIASTTTSMSAVRIILFLWHSSWVQPLILFRSASVDNEITLSPHVETSILPGTRVLSISLEKTNKQKTGHSCSHHSSRRFSSWKVMVPKVIPYDVDLGPVCILSRPLSCLRDKRPKQYPTAEHCEVVQECKARRRCCCSPGKCLISWGRAFEQQKHRQGSSYLLQLSRLLENQQQRMQQ